MRHCRDPGSWCAHIHTVVDSRTLNRARRSHRHRESTVGRSSPEWQQPPAGTTAVVEPWSTGLQSHRMTKYCALHSRVRSSLCSVAAALYTYSLPTVIQRRQSGVTCIVSQPWRDQSLFRLSMWGGKTRTLRLFTIVVLHAPVIVTAIKIQYYCLSMLFRFANSMYFICCQSKGKSRMRIGSCVISGLCLRWTAFWPSMYWCIQGKHVETVTPCNWTVCRFHLQHDMCIFQIFNSWCYQDITIKVMGDNCQYTFCFVQLML